MHTASLTTADASRFSIPLSRRKRWAPALLAAVAMLFASAWLPGDDAQPRARNAKPKKAPQAAVEQGGVNLLATFSKFPDWVACVAFSPDGRTLAAGSYEAAKLFDTGEKKEIAELVDKTGFVKSAAFSPDGKLLATGSYQETVLWDASTKKRARSLTGHQGYVTGVAFSPDGKTLATASEDETVRLWDTATGESRLKLTGHTRAVTAVAFSPDGQQLASCSGDVTRPTKKGEVKVWNPATGAERLAIDAHDRAITSVAFSPDGKTLATASFDETIKLWDAATGKELRTLEGHSRPVNCVVFLPDGRSLASAGGGRNEGGNAVKVWDLQSGQARATLEDYEAPVHQVAVSPDGRLLASASHDKTAKLWAIPVFSDGAEKKPAALAAATDAKPEAKDKGAAQPAAEKPDAEKPNAAKPEAPKTDAAKVKELRAGIIGLDTSHAVAFTQALNAKDAAEDIAGCRIVAAYPKGSPDIESSTSRVPGYTKTLQGLGVEIVESIDDLLKKVDVVFLETNDGRPHFEQVLPVLKAGKPVFIDKPIAASLSDAIAIFEASKRYKVPLFSSSSLRFTKNAQAIRNGKIGEIVGCDSYSPCSLEATHPDLYWYGIHGVETLFTIMGPGCEQVTRLSTPGADLVAGTWKGGRIGTFRGMRAGKPGYGAMAYGSKGNEQVGSYEGYRPLIVEIVKFFRTGVVPIAPEETLEIYAFMEAADESKRQGGVPVALESVMAKAREAAKAKAKE